MTRAIDTLVARQAVVQKYGWLVLGWALLGLATGAGVMGLGSAFGPLWGNLAALPLGYGVVRLGMWAGGS